MKAAVAIVMTLAVASILGCAPHPRCGSMVKDEGSTLVVPTASTDVKQGELRIVTCSLAREGFFKQDVKLHIKAAKGISVEPVSITVKASDKPDVQLQIAVAKDAALGEYPLVVKGTPGTGCPASVGFTVNVISP